MNKREAENRNRMYSALQAAGFTFSECEQLRRISMTLTRWFEQECGNSDNYKSWAIERDENGEGKPFMVIYPHDSNKVRRYAIPDRETGARKRLDKIMQAHAGMSAYVQTDPRGCALYILRPGDINGQPVESSYNRGIAVY